MVKIGELEAHFLFENETFSTQIGEIEAHSFFENWQFSTKICEKLSTFVKIGEIEAHSFFENWILNFLRKLVRIAKSNAQAAIAQALRASHRGRSSLGQRPATLFISAVSKG